LRNELHGDGLHVQLFAYHQSGMPRQESAVLLGDQRDQHTALFNVVFQVRKLQAVRMHEIFGILRILFQLSDRYLLNRR
jgi:hypothetical protein